MPIKESEFDRKNREWHEHSRAEDARRLAAKEVTQKQLQEENSLVPNDVKITLTRESMKKFVLEYYNY